MSGALAAVAGVVLLSAAAQVLLKRGVDRLVTRRGFRALLASVSPALLGGGAALLAAPPLYFLALTRLELGLAFAATALTQGVVAVAGRLLLGERLRPLQLAGVGLVLAGLLVWNL
ncbi:MAG: hypothetical protein JW820_17325 [Spirochaetales bacterium]|nr:hypothetical protein [Spirochaetales bacterium]